MNDSRENHESDAVPVEVGSGYSPAGELPIEAAEQVDATGLICPEPLMLVRNRVRAMQSGQVVHVLATDPAAGRDFRDFCRFMGHELLDERDTGAVREFWIRKG